MTVKDALGREILKDYFVAAATLSRKSSHLRIGQVTNISNGGRVTLTYPGTVYKMGQGYVDCMVKSTATPSQCIILSPEGLTPEFLSKFAEQ